MIYGMRQLAVSHGFDEHAFQEWADREGQRHGAFLEEKTYETVVCSWHVDQLIKAAREAGFFRIDNPMAVPNAHV